jgi:hypothetical protein
MPEAPPESSELIAALERMPNRIAALIANLSDEAVRRRNADHHFSAVETVCHLRDLEVEGYTIRIERLLNEEQPVLANIDGGRLAAERDYNSQNIQEALAAFDQARAGNVSILRSLDPGQLTRGGTLEGVGSVTLERLVAMIEEHDAGHLDELSSLCATSQKS